MSKETDNLYLEFEDVKSTLHSLVEEAREVAEERDQYKELLIEACERIIVKVIDIDKHYMEIVDFTLKYGNDLEFLNKPEIKELLESK